MWNRGKTFMRSTLTKTALALMLVPGMALAGQAERQTLRPTLAQAEEGAPAPVAERQPKGPTPKPSAIDVNPLTLYVRTVYPDDVNTVGEAAQYLLQASGYLLVTDYPAPSRAKLIAEKSIPPIAKVHRTMPVMDALQLLIGDDNWIVVDHTHRLVSFAEEK